MGRAWATRRWVLVCVLLLAFTPVGGCRSTLARMPAYQYFARPAPDDAWSAKIRGWQERERRSHTPATVAKAGNATPRDLPPGDLRASFNSFRREHKRALARELAVWVQAQARDHYVADGPIDHWATLEETFEHNGDDCDGLELLAFNMLRELGFSDSEVYRAIVVRRSDGQHHMVTLWFEDSQDPWVIDPTGAMTLGMPHMSDLPDWTPLKVFSEDRNFTVLDALHTAQR
jgi:predicted transglutaminase-like cysteine proteinase